MRALPGRPGVGDWGGGEGSLLCMEIHKNILQYNPFIWRRNNLGDPFSVPDSPHKRAAISFDNSTTREKRTVQCDWLWKAPEAFSLLCSQLVDPHSFVLNSRCSNWRRVKVVLHNSNLREKSDVLNIPYRQLINRSHWFHCQALPHYDICH